MNILLVHGAFHDERCWDALVPHLSQRGHDVKTVTLRGHGQKSAVKPYRVSMSAYAEDVCRAAEEFPQPCCVIGHSMAGLVITAAAEKKPILFKQLVYLAALVPGQNGLSLAAHDKKYPSINIRRALKIKPFLLAATMEPNAAKDIFYNLCSDELKSTAVQMLCEQPLRPSLSKVSWSEERVGGIPKAYIECRLDNAIPIYVQRTMQRNMAFTSIQSLESDHSPFLSIPVELASCISNLAGGQE